MKSIVLTGDPMSTQNLYINAGGRRFKNPKAQERKLQYKWEAKSQWNRPIIEGDVCINMVLYFGTKRKADIDNFNKIAWDSLTGIVYKDDSQITEAHIFKKYDKENPRIEISIPLDDYCWICDKTFKSSKGLAQHNRLEHEHD